MNITLQVYDNTTLACQATAPDAVTLDTWMTITALYDISNNTVSILKDSQVVALAPCSMYLPDRSVSLAQVGMGFPLSGSIKLSLGELLMHEASNDMRGLVIINSKVASNVISAIEDTWHFSSEKRVYQPMQYFDTCVSCKRGYYKSVNGSSACTACSIGTYSTTFGATSCLLCPPGSSTLAVGSSSLNSCVSDSGSVSSG